MEKSKARRSMGFVGEPLYQKVPFIFQWSYLVLAFILGISLYSIHEWEHMSHWRIINFKCGVISINANSTEDDLPLGNTTSSLVVNFRLHSKRASPLQTKKFVWQAVNPVSIPDRGRYAVTQMITAMAVPCHWIPSGT